MIDANQYHLSIKDRSRRLNIYPSRLALNAQKRHFAGLEGAAGLRSPFTAKITSEQPSKPVKLTATGVIYTG